MMPAVTVDGLEFYEYYLPNLGIVRLEKVMVDRFPEENHEDEIEKLLRKEINNMRLKIYGVPR